MRSVNAIDGEIGQLWHQIQKYRLRIQELENEKASMTLTAKGYFLGRTIEYKQGDRLRTGKIIGHRYNDRNELVVGYIKKNGEIGQTVYIGQLFNVRVKEESPCA